MSTPDQKVLLPVELRMAVRDWVIGTYGLDNPGVPITLIERVDLGGQTVYRIEADVKGIVASPHRMPVYMDVFAQTNAPYQIDPDSVVFFDDEG